MDYPFIHGPKHPVRRRSDSNERKFFYILLFFCVASVFSGVVLKYLDVEIENAKLKDQIIVLKARLSSNGGRVFYPSTP